MALTVSRSADIDASLDAVRSVLRDLATYPDWMPIVSSVEADDDDHSFVELRVPIGPFARSKRLRMKRTIDESSVVVFARYEADGRSHANWELRLELNEVDSGTAVHALLRYDGKMWTPGPVEEALDRGLDAGILQLQEFVSKGSDTNPSTS